MDIFDIKLKGPGKNALGTQMMKWLVDQLDEAAGRPILLSGDGNAFSAGLNLKEVAALDAKGMTHFLTLLDEMAARLYTYPGPTVAWVNGHAIAGGAVLALCCDHRVASSYPEARIGLNEVALGLPFPPAILRIVQERVPAHCLNEVVLGAELFSPKRAHELGLVDHVCDRAESMARKRAEALGKHPAHGYREVKHALRRCVLEISQGERDRFHERNVPAWVSPDLKSKIAALLGR